MSEPKPPPLQVLLVEDNLDDAELIARALRDGGLEIEARVVASEATLRAALAAWRPDLALVDWNVPGFSGAAAVTIARERDPALPVILVSGTVGDELVTHFLRVGATDYVAKGHLEALVPAVRRALEEATSRRERLRVGAERDRMAAAVEQASDFIIVDDASGIVQSVNPAFERLTGYRADEVLGLPVASLLRSGVDPPEVYAALDKALRRGAPWSGRLKERRADGSLFHVDLSVSPIRDATGALIGSVEIGHDRTSEAERDRATRLRAALGEVLHAQPPDASLEVAAQTLCDHLAALPGIDVATVFLFGRPGEIQAVAHHAPPGFPPGHSHPALRSARMHERSLEGPWAEAWVPSEHDGTWGRAIGELGARAAGHWPVRHADHVDGDLVIATSDAGFAATLLEDGAASFDLGSTSSALLGERMHARRVEHERHDALAALLAARAFHPVFQSIVDLETGETLGYEALTRFDSGQRPDLCFADAWSVGLGPELELATLEAAVDAAKELPAGTWLDLNVSPRLLADPGRLRGILGSADRALVLEVTEHELIGDYDALRRAVRDLGPDIRLAVDDAGAGVANFAHIIDLRPDYVKLDISLVRRVNANTGRQAMVVGMRHFSRTAGCRLIAEGIETEDEARTLRALGVEFGQGYLYGHPGPVADWTAARAAAAERSQLELPRLPDEASTGDFA